MSSFFRTIFLDKIKFCENHQAMKRFLALIPLLFLFSSSPSSNDMGISLETNYRNYRPKQSIKINIKLPQAAYLYVLALQSDGSLTLLYPNEDEQDNMVFAEEIRIPDDAKDYEFLAGDVLGKDTIYAIASRNRIKKLHKSKYWKKPVYRNINPNNMSWLKKLTKKLPPEQWVSADVNIFISKDGVTEITSPSPPKKEAKTITPSLSDTPPKENGTNKSKKEFAQGEVMHGYFKLPNSARTSEDKRGYFSLHKDSDLNKYKLKIIPYLANSNDVCDYSVISFTDPRKIKGTYGTIEVVPGECILKEAGEEQKEFWKRITNFYLQYQFKKSGSLKGNIWLTGKDDKYNQKMIKPEVKDDFKFLE